MSSVKNYLFPTIHFSQYQLLIGRSIHKLAHTTHVQLGHQVSVGIKLIHLHMLGVSFVQLIRACNTVMRCHIDSGLDLAKYCIYGKDSAYNV